MCYTSDGPVSTVVIGVELSCTTEDHAFVRSSISDSAEARAEVCGAECTVSATEVSARGEIGKVLVSAFDVNGQLRSALQTALRKRC